MWARVCARMCVGVRVCVCGCVGDCVWVCVCVWECVGTSVRVFVCVSRSSKRIRYVRERGCVDVCILRVWVCVYVSRCVNVGVWTCVFYVCVSPGKWPYQHEMRKGDGF